ncbi:hypothetical protein Z517_04512 [Fonsecaea pedrosoi CBS 271.37]|uniref:Uncharacterized protein n=1 Tax=Fonsecaea pedrosoi CBS 271.37 TaxID=1442368 RepID=A0A0D2F4C6_9EURO|nr:uncharacterized protein Z517_04512 [Fonsecaea pedrosoi CBS 271.37]KIW81487.1 hypothetical protein Z517_04512 [Fonsecaea pedrosoi CBS 271.37]
MPSASPLRMVDTNTCSTSPARPVLSARASVTSRTSSIPVTPLDDIPEKLWPRVIRTTTAAEISNPELSIDEITSTKLSLDDQAILTNVPRESSRKETQSRKLVKKVAFGGIWGENNDRLKKMTKRLKKIPNGLFARKEREPSLPPLELTSELCVKSTCTSSNAGDSDARRSQAPMMDYECKVKESESCVEEMTKISSLIRKDLHEFTNKDRILPPQGPGNYEPLPRHLPRHFTQPPAYAYAASTSTLHSIHVAEDRLLHGPRSLKAFSRHNGVTRASSIGSVEEMRSHAFGSRRVSRPSLSSGPARHRSAPSISRISQSASRPVTHAGSISSVSATIVPPRRQVVYMDTPSSCSEFVWDGHDSKKRPSTSFTARPVSKGGSFRSSQDGHASLSLNLAPEVELGLGELPGYNKVPLYVPRRIELAEPFEVSPLDEPSEHKQKFFLHSKLKNSNPTISDVSFASLQGQTSIRSHLEREAMIQEQESETSETRPSMGGCEKLSRAFCSAWSETTTRRWHKGYKRHGM